jgi:sulfate permease, SulP family
MGIPNSRRIGVARIANEKFLIQAVAAPLADPEDHRRLVRGEAETPQHVSGDKTGKDASAPAVPNLALGLLFDRRVQTIAKECAASGLTGGALAAIFATTVARPSFVISAPRASISTAYRHAQNLSHVRTEASRDVFSQGVGNLASALFGGVAAAASSAHLTANYEAGGRSRLSVVTAATLLIAVRALMTPAWGYVPAMVVWAILIAIAVTLFDVWSLRALRELLLHPASGSWKNVAVATLVTVITASLDVITGVLAGILLAGILFIADMSRSIVHRRYWGDEVCSKRRRPSGDMELLRASARRRAVLELQGVMFFGNADELSHEVSALFREVDMLALDLSGVTDIDFSAATILQYESARSRGSSKQLLLCIVLPQLAELLTTAETSAAAVPSSAIMPDLDAALEWMEEETLRKLARANQDRIPLERNVLFRGMTEDERRTAFMLLHHRTFEAGEVISYEGDEVADQMWILTSGTVSIRLNFVQGKRSRRVASLGPGTVVGEIAFIESGRRSATIIADEHVECYVLDRAAYALIGAAHPQIASKMLANLLHESMIRLRHADEELSGRNR